MSYQCFQAGSATAKTSSKTSSVCVFFNFIAEIGNRVFVIVFFILQFLRVIVIDTFKKGK